MSTAHVPLTGPAVTPAPEPTPGRAGTTPRWVLVAMLANLVCEIGIVVTGGLVRLTGSGLGCTTWPDCVPGSFVPVAQQAQGWHKYVEFGNRSLITVLTIAAVAALAAGVAQVRSGRASRRFGWWSLTPLLGVVAQAVMGGITVLTHLSPITVAVHFLLSMVVIAGAALLYLAVRDDLTPPQPGRELRWLTVALAALTAVILALGTAVTGSGPHAGDAQARRFGFNPRDVSVLHADAVLLFTGLVVGLVLVVRLTGAGPAVRRRAWWVVAVTVGQGVLGYAEYAARLPIALVALHMLGASLLVVAVTALVAGVFGVRPLVRPTDRA